MRRLAVSGKGIGSGPRKWYYNTTMNKLPDFIFLDGQVHIGRIKQSAMRSLSVDLFPSLLDWRANEPKERMVSLVYQSSAK